jgi:hypothetical protein
MAMGAMGISASDASDVDADTMNEVGEQLHEEAKEEMNDTANPMDTRAE